MFFRKRGRVLKILICSILIAAMFTETLPMIQSEFDNSPAHAYEHRYHFKRYTDDSKPLKHMYYHLYVPEDYDESLAYPLVIYLSLIGQDVAVNSMNYIDSSLLANGNDEKYPCIILIPLLPEDLYWVDNYFGKISDGLDLTMGMIDFICQEYSVDQRKIYISGMCFTATGAWDALFRYPTKFAAGILVANIAPLSLASKITDVPLWIFNSSTDSQVPATQSQGMVEALRNAGNTKVRYTEYKNYDHVEASTAPFWEEDLFPWMFSQTNFNAPFPEGKIPIEDFKKNPKIKDTLSDGNDTIPPVGKNENILSNEKTDDMQDESIVDNKQEDISNSVVPEKETEGLKDKLIDDSENNVGDVVHDDKTEAPKGELFADNKTIDDNTSEAIKTLNAPSLSHKKSNIWIVCIGVMAVACLGVLSVLLYRKRFFKRTKNNHDNKKLNIEKE